MKAITLTQPWASLIACGEKKIETRSWATSHRGPILIHAAKGYPAAARAFAAHPAIEALLARHGLNPMDLPTGVFVAQAVLTSVAPVQDLIPRLSFQELSLGDFTHGRFGFVLIDRQPVKPTPAVGRLSVWNA